MLTIQLSPFPELTTQRLHLRRILPGDASDLFLLRSDSTVMKYIDRPLARDINDAHELINRIDQALQNNDGITWGIFIKGQQGLIGTIGFWRIMKEHFRAEIGYMIGTQWQGRGLVQEAMETVLKYGFDVLKFHSVEANVNPSNDASIRLLERNQFVKEAYFKENYYYNGQFLDSLIYSRLTPNT